MLGNRSGRPHSIPKSIGPSKSFVQQRHGTGPIGDLVVDIGGGQHRLVAFDAGLVLDPAEDSPLASVQPAVDIGVHSKTSWGRMVEGVKYLDCSLKPEGFGVSPLRSDSDYAWLRTNSADALAGEARRRLRSGPRAARGP